MFENDLSFSDTIEIVPSVEANEAQVEENVGPIIVNEVVETVEPKQEVVVETKEEVKIEKRNERKNDREKERKEFKPNKSEDSKPSLRQQSLYNATAKIYVERYSEYNGIPDYIVNQIFDIDDGKGYTTIEEAVIMFINLFPNTREKINSARYIEDALKTAKSEIVNSLYKECKYGYINIPMHSRENLSNKITSDFENENFDAALYDYQLMRLSGFLKNI